MLKAINDCAAFDARNANLIIGTSAGAILGLTIRAGMSPDDAFALHTGNNLSSDGVAIINRIVTPYSEEDNERSDVGDYLPQSPEMTLRALWPPWKIRPLHAAMGLLPNGTRTAESLEQRLAEMHPDPWPAEPFWVPAVRLNDGRRVVFGRDDVDAHAALAVRASCAVPACYAPVTVDGRRYVDGGAHSSTNADLAAAPCFDVVLVSSVMSGDAGWSKVAGSWKQAINNKEWSNLWSDKRAVKAAKRHWMSDRLTAEVVELRSSGAAVLVVEPDAELSDWLDTDAHAGADSDDNIRAKIAQAGYDTAAAELSSSKSFRVRAALSRAVELQATS